MNKNFVAIGIAGDIWNASAPMAGVYRYGHIRVQLPIRSGEDVADAAASDAVIIPCHFIKAGADDVPNACSPARGNPGIRSGIVNVSFFVAYMTVRTVVSGCCEDSGSQHGSFLKRLAHSIDRGLGPGKISRFFELSPSPADGNDRRGRPSRGQALSYDCRSHNVYPALLGEWRKINDDGRSLGHGSGHFDVECDFELGLTFAISGRIRGAVHPEREYRRRR